MIHQEDTHKQVFAALLHDRTLPSTQDFDAEFETIDSPKTIQGRYKSPFAI